MSFRGILPLLIFFIVFFCLLPFFVPIGKFADCPKDTQHFPTKNSPACNCPSVQDIQQFPKDDKDDGSSWKDPWIVNWIKQNTNKDYIFAECKTDICEVPKYLAPRKKADTPQKIPRVMWFTWKKHMIRNTHWPAIASWISSNPEYEVIFFEDNDINKFVCEQTSIELQRTYASVYSGAAKADIWRLLIIEKYGGVYLDFDTSCNNPLSRYISPDDDIVSGLDENGFHQWAMLYSPRHPILTRVVEIVIKYVREDYVTKNIKSIIALTGQDPFMEGIRQILKANGCMTNQTNYELHKLADLPTCSRTYPYKVGKLHITEGRLGAVNFKFWASANDFTTYNHEPIYVGPEKITEFLESCASGAY